MKGTADGARITLKRNDNYSDKLRKYRIFLNQEPWATISAGEELTLDVPSGLNILEARIDWCRSKNLHLDLTEGEHAHVSIANTFGAFAALWAITVGRKRYLTLTRLS